MFRKNVVLIFGAGTNFENGFYLGSQLINHIAGDFVKDIKKILSTSGPQTNRDKLIGDSSKLRSVINANVHDNIDHLLALHEELEEIGKLGIAYQIIKGERVSKDSKNVILYEKIFHELVSSIKIPKDIQTVFDNKLTIITFNYDRSLEYYIKNSIEHFVSPSIRKFEYNEIFQNIIKVLHVYGSLGTLNENGNDFLPYGSELIFQNIKKASESIDVIYGSKQNKHRSEIQSAINNADLLFFLGFGYDINNLQQLNLPNALKEGCKAYGMGFNLNEEIVNRMNSLFTKFKLGSNHKIIIPNIDCIKFFDDYVKKYAK
jgi:hypothetical protein